MEQEDQITPIRKRSTDILIKSRQMTKRSASEPAFPSYYSELNEEEGHGEATAKTFQYLTMGDKVSLFSEDDSNQGFISTLGYVRREERESGWGGREGGREGVGGWGKGRDEALSTDKKFYDGVEGGGRERARKREREKERAEYYVYRDSLIWREGESVEGGREGGRERCVCEHKYNKWGIKDTLRPAILREGGRERKGEEREERERKKARKGLG